MFFVSFVVQLNRSGVDKRHCNQRTDSFRSDPGRANPVGSVTRLMFRRKKAFEALSQLSTSGWVEKIRIQGLTKYHIAEEGARQLQRLATASDGPVRRALRPS